MPKKTSSPKKNWGVEITDHDANGKLIYGSDGKPLKKKINMQDGRFTDGSPQPLYFGPDHPRAGIFKGMAVILQERGFTEESKLCAECPKFKCKPGETKCCCRRVLYSQPDFVAVESLLETHCKARGFSVIFFPKFHCELNFIKQCWGYAKQIYRHFPPSSKEADLEANLLEALESVPLTSMWQFVILFSALNAYFTHSKQFSVVDLQLVPGDLLMLMIRVLMESRQLGLPKNTVVIKCCQKVLWQILIMLNYCNVK